MPGLAVVAAVDPARAPPAFSHAGLVVEQGELDREPGVGLVEPTELAARARELLARLGYEVDVIVGDGTDGYPPRSPYAGIVVAAAAPSVPDPLVAQLAVGARLVIPIGPRDVQHLTVVERSADGTREVRGEAAVFVPLVGHHGYEPRR